MSAISLAQPQDESNYVWLIPVLRDGKPWKFIRRPDGTDANRIEVKVSDRPAILLNGVAFSMAEGQVN